MALEALLGLINLYAFGTHYVSVLECASTLYNVMHDYALGITPRLCGAYVLARTVKYALILGSFKKVVLF